MTFLKLRVHKELFGQTDFLREILSSSKEHCCGTIEVLCPCSRVELKHLVNFLSDGEINCENETDLLKVIENLQKIFGFPENLDLSYQNETFFDSVNNIEAMTITGEVFEDILDDPNAEKVVIIPLRSKDVRGKHVANYQGKEDNVLDNGEKEVSEKKKKSKKNTLKKAKVSSMKRYPKLFCNDCGGSFLFKSQLQSHLNEVHLKLRPYECDQCQKTFSRKYNLNLHIETQSNCNNLKKKYKCNECDASFEKTKYLKAHVNRIHLKIKPLKFICHECEAPFEEKKCLEHHTNKVHLNLKPYECDLCKKAFFIEASLKKHRKAFHKEEAK